MRQEDWEQFQKDGRLIEERLSGYFNTRPHWGTLYESMEYSLLAGGKRLRPALTLAFCRLLGGKEEAALPLACAVEMVHTYSLIHDDLPCMDDDDLRRGRPTNHKVYGDAMAVLAGDALLTAAFEAMLTPEAGGLTRSQAADAAFVLARAAGHSGMIAGQTLDIAEGQRTEEALLDLHSRKTGALLQAAAVMGCIAAGGTDEDIAAARAYAGHLGLAFQIRDDLLDVEGDAALLGKATGSDAAAGKVTFVTLLGAKACRMRIQTETERAKAALNHYAGRDYLCQLADWLAGRDH